MNEELQGCTSVIRFPLCQDERAISSALSQLLREGWKFLEITKTHISIVRQWEYDPKIVQGMTENEK